MQNQNELTQSINSAFSGQQQRVLLALLARIEAPLPIATESDLGAVKIGDGLTIDADGVLSVTGD